MTQGQTSGGAGQSLHLQRRTHYCGEPRTGDVGRELLVKGWVHFARDHGGIQFVDLRDRTGLLQVVFDPHTLTPAQYEQCKLIRDEYVIAVKGVLRKRLEGTANAHLPTGEIELEAREFEILNTSKVTPFKLDEHHGDVKEEVRLHYRYLDLRRPAMQRIMMMRSQLMQVVRNYLAAQGFIEFETPILTKSTPEGARDFLVPSRWVEGQFYALPQSPQLFKQSLMISGYDKYFQIARCFRDEDLRGNRQPEFTQIDIEMSFITPDDLFLVMEGMIASIYREIKGIDVKPPFRRIAYDEAMLRWGSDKPDLRFELEIKDITQIFKTGCDFKVFNSVIESGGVIRAINVPGGAEKYSNTQLKPGGELAKHAEVYKAKGLAWFKLGAAGLDSSITKFFTKDTLDKMIAELGSQTGDLILLVGDKVDVTATALGQLRLKLGRELGLIDPDKLEFAWIVDFPLFNWNEDEKRWDPSHHPFTSPAAQDLHLLGVDNGKIKSWAYDLALNGEEIGGGSIRIHDSEVQRKIFETIGITGAEAESKFGFLLEALTYGAPPHGGIAFGLDRIMMQLSGESSIREVIPFPKTQTGGCLMTDAPSPVDPKQLRELRIKVVEKPKA